MVLNTSNFREINYGKISPNTLYRSDHPIHNGRQVKDIMCVNKVKIKTIINLADNIHLLKTKIINCPRYKKILEENNVIALNIDMKFDILEEQFIKKIKNSLVFILEHEPPYLIHCEAGIDRTGLLSMIMEAFMEATFDDIVKDYELSFIDNSEYSMNNCKFGTSIIINVFSKIKGELINPNEDLQDLSKKYLLDIVGLNKNEIIRLKDKLMRKEV